MITAHLINNNLISTSQDAFALYEKSRWGEKKKGKIEYTHLEALALLEQSKLELYDKKKKLTEEQLVKKAKKQDKRIEVKHAVFADLRKRGYVVKTALKFGAEFRVYDKGIRPSEDHAMWLCFPVREHEMMTWHDFAAKTRVATSTNKKLLLAVVDDESDVTYYEVAWMRP